MTNEYDSELDENLVYTPLNLNVVRQNVPTYTSPKLCEMIVCHRYFGCYSEIAIMCMEELAKRREAGDPFQFEQYIDQAHKELPEINLTAVNVGDVLQQAFGRKVK